MKLALLISGGGTTATHIMNACKPGGILHRLVEPTLLIASNAKAGGLQRTLATGMIESLDQVIIDPKSFTNPNDFGQAILDECTIRNVEFIGQYGWMPRTPGCVILAYEDRMINQHPGPLEPGRPDFGGEFMHGRRVHCARLFVLSYDKKRLLDGSDGPESISRMGSRGDSQHRTGGYYSVG